MPRPDPDKRCFSSPIIEQVIEDTRGKIQAPKLAELFVVCFPNTLDTTVTLGNDDAGRADTFVVTGDIDAMWLRDSTNQVWPYLPFAGSDPALQRLLQGVIAKSPASSPIRMPMRSTGCRIRASGSRT